MDDKLGRNRRLLDNSVSEKKVDGRKRSPRTSEATAQICRQSNTGNGRRLLSAL
jgi:hypothetical protein